MGRISTSVAPTQTFNILLHTSDGGAKRRRRLKICLIVTTILVLLGVIGAIIGVTVFVVTKSPFEELMKGGDNQTLLLIGGNSTDNTFVNEVEVIGIEKCPKLESLPETDRNHKTLSTLTKDNYLIICTEYFNVIACHSKLVETKKTIEMPGLINDTTKRAISKNEKIELKDPDLTLTLIYFFSYL